MELDMKYVSGYLQHFDFVSLFKMLNWYAMSQMKAVPIYDTPYTRFEIARQDDSVIFEIHSADGDIPDVSVRKVLYEEISLLYSNIIVIFVDKNLERSLWRWGKYEGTKRYQREYIYFKGQPAETFLNRLDSILADITTHKNVGKIQRSQERKVPESKSYSKTFFEEFEKQRSNFLQCIEGIDNEHGRQWYATVLFTRLIFIYFLQRKGFLDNGNMDYLQQKLRQVQMQGADLYYKAFLLPLFFDGFGKMSQERSKQTNILLGNRIPYLNGNLFLRHPVEQQSPTIWIPDEAFKNLLDFFSLYAWRLEDTPGSQNYEITPDVLGQIFEKYINKKSIGAFSTPVEITDFLCKQTIHSFVLKKIQAQTSENSKSSSFVSIEDLLLNLDAPLCQRLLFDILPGLSVLDPACGSGGFLVAAMKTLMNIYGAILGKISSLHEETLDRWVQSIQKYHSSPDYSIKKKIITNNLFGVDILEEAIEIARLRLYLTLITSAQKVEEIEPLSDIKFNIQAGNALIGLIHCNRQVDSNRTQLNEHLLEEFKHYGISYEQMIWDRDSSEEGKPRKRTLTIDDILVLHPFHWCQEFDQVIQKRGGFDVIISNPPWDIVKANVREFIDEHFDLAAKYNITSKSVIKNLLEISELREMWLTYESRFRYERLYFYNAEQYQNQHLSSRGKIKAQRDALSYYNLFVERCYTLLHDEGQCGLVVPEEIYNNTRSQRLREMLFTKTHVTSLISFENRRRILEGLSPHIKFALVTFEKGGTTSIFPATFNRWNIEDLENFPEQNSVLLSVNLIRRFSPDSLSIPECESELDVFITQKMLKFPSLREISMDTWNLKLIRGFEMISGSKMYQLKVSPTEDDIPVYEGKMIQQFSLTTTQPRFWSGKQMLLRQNQAITKYHLGCRTISNSCNERTIIATILPPEVIAANSILIISGNLDGQELLFITAVLNSFVIDFFARLH
ncbi:MAG: ATP-binding protein, partial [Bacteroidota bacterium]|nr:ATP-binding protein [Bacteroidota bacterium]